VTFEAVGYEEELLAECEFCVFFR